MNQIIHLSGIVLLLFGVFSCERSPVIPERPNILFITTDYTRGQDLPRVGAPFLKMPAVNKLSDEGAIFLKHACVSPICMPARATIVTGHYPHAHSLWDNVGISFREEVKPFLISELKKEGYTTVGVGKMHFHPFTADYDYDLRYSLEGKDRKYRDDDYEAYLNERGSKRLDIYNLNRDSKIPRGQSFFDWPLDEDLHADAFVGNKSVEAVQSGILKKDKPWFMWVSFTGPHNPWNAPERFSSIYRNMEDLPSGDFVAGELDNKPLDYTRHRYGYGGNLFDHYDSLPKPEQDKLRHNVRAAHYGSLSFIDEQIAKVIGALEEKGLLENTMIIFTSDHGSALFDNEMLHKGSPFPTQSIVPMVVWYPGFVKPGFRDNFTSHADLFATIMELSGQKDIAETEGRSFLEMFYKPDSKVNDFVIVESAMVTSLMNKDWLLGVHHITEELELYNLQKDPMCHYNIADKPENKGRINGLIEQLVAWRKSQSGGDKVKNNPFTWHEELGDTTQINKYRRRYTREYQRLTTIADERPGKTGKAAAAILENISENLK